MTQLKVLLCFISCGAFSLAGASPWDESFLGIERSAHQDTLGIDNGRDLFSTGSNPAWLPEKSSLATTLSYHKGHVGSRASESPEVMLLGMGAHLSKNTWGGGMLVLLPFLDSAVIDTGKVRGRVTPWTARSRQVQMQPYLGKSFFESRLNVALMMPISFDVKSQSELRLDSAEPSTRVKAGLDPNVSWGAGAWFAMNPKIEVSLAYRERKRSDAYVNIEGSVPVLGGPSIDLLANGSSPYVFEPRRVTLQSSYHFSERVTAGLWGRFTQWKEMPAPVLVLNYTSPSLRTVIPDFKARNTLEVGAGVGFLTTGGTRFYASYRYAPTPFQQSLYFYDRNTHHVGLGTSVSFEDDWKLGLYGRISLLEEGGLYSYLGLGLGLDL